MVDSDKSTSDISFDEKDKKITYSELLIQQGVSLPLHTTLKLFLILELINPHESKTYELTESKLAEYIDEEIINRINRFFLETYEQSKDVCEDKWPHIKNLVSGIIKIESQNNNEIIINSNEENMKQIEEIIESDDFDVLEVFLIEPFIDAKYSFDEFGNYLYLYLYDNLKRLREDKTLTPLKKILNVVKDETKIDQKKLEEQFKKLYSVIYHKIYVKRDIYFREQLKFSKQYKSNLALTPNQKEPAITDPKIIEEMQIEKAFNDFLSMLFIRKLMRESEELDLTQNQILSEGMPLVLNCLKINPLIKKITINTNRLGEEGMWTLGRVFHFHQNIIDLDLSNNGIRDEELKALEMGFGTAECSLKRLNLSTNVLGLRSGKILSKLLEKMNDLKYLNISRNPLEKSFTQICYTLNRLTILGKINLEFLVAMSCKIDSNGIEMLSEYISNAKCTLQNLVLSDNKLNNNEGRKFLKNLIKNQSLEELILFKTNIDNTMIDELYNCLHNNQNIVSFNMYENKLDDEDNFIKILSVLQSTAPYERKTLRQKSKTDPGSMIFEDDESKMDLRDIKLAKTNKLRNFDISLNNCKIIVNKKLIKILKSVDIDMLDMTQNTFNVDEYQLAKDKINQILVKKDKYDIRIIY